MKVALGKKVPKLDKRTLKMEDFLVGVPIPPDDVGYVDAVTKWPMMRNDELGDCVYAAAGHMIQQWTTYAAPPGFIPSDADVVRGYSEASGYVEGDSSTDNGAFMLDALNYWRKKGIGGHKIMAFVSVNPRSQKQMKQAIWLFGNCYIGAGLPVSAQRTPIGVNGLPVWSLPSPNDENGAFGSWGGHAIPIVGYGSDTKGNKGTMLVTWGELFDATWGFLKAYCDEAYAVLSEDWIDAQGLSPSHFNLAQLKLALNNL